jgi:uncharacterized membrane protein
MIYIFYNIINYIFSIAISPAKTTLYLLLIFGSFFILITPPYQSPDEDNHFIRSYHLSQLNIIAKTEESNSTLLVGEFLPKSLKESQLSFNDLKGNVHNKTSIKIIINELKRELKEPDTQFYSFSSSAVYSPIPYMPQTIGITLGRTFDAPPIILLYLARIFNLIFASLLCYLAVKNTPVFKWTFVLIITLPMTISLFSSASGDALVISTSFLFFAYLLKYHYLNNLNYRNIIYLGILGIIITLCKPGYIFLPLLALALFFTKYNVKKTIIISIIFTLSILLLPVLWNASVSEMYIAPFREQQIQTLINNPYYIFKLLLNTYNVLFSYYYIQFIGSLGWLDTNLSQFAHIFPLSIIMLLTYIYELNNIKLPHLFLRISSLGLFILITIFISLTLFINWDTNNDMIIEGIQGRYFIPLSPLLLIGFSNHLLNLKVNIKRKHLIVPTAIILSLILTILFLIQRYYV